MSQNQTPPIAVPDSLPTLSTAADKVQLAAATLADLSKAFSTPGKETALSAIKSTLIAAGAVAASAGWVQGSVILSAIGVLLGLASAGYTLFDDWRAAHAASAAVSDAVFQGKLGAIDSAIGTVAGAGKDGAL